MAGVFGPADASGVAGAEVGISAIYVAPDRSAGFLTGSLSGHAYQNVKMFELDGGTTHFLEGRMDASFGTTPLAMSRAVRLMERGLVDVEQIISHRIQLQNIQQAVDIMAGPNHNKVVINP